MIKGLGVKVTDLEAMQRRGQGQGFAGPRPLLMDERADARAGQSRVALSPDRA